MLFEYGCALFICAVIIVLAVYASHYGEGDE